MKLIKRTESRQFNFHPQRYKPPQEETEQRISFKRKTLYDPHVLVRGQVTYVLIAVVVIIIIMLLGGIRPNANPPAVTVEDVVGHKIEE
jgi:hypothetical protein